MVNQRVLYPPQIGRCGRYKYIRTSGYCGPVVIFVKKRFLGFLWWVFVKDMNGSPITYNKLYDAKAFMNGIIKYYDQAHHEYIDFGNDAIVKPMTDELAWEQISKAVERKLGVKPRLEFVKRAWELDRKRYIHVAAQYAELWEYIEIKKAEQNGKTVTVD